VKRKIFILFLLFPITVFSLEKTELDTIADTIGCLNIENDNTRLNCFENNAKKLESVFPLAKLNEEERTAKIESIKKIKKIESFGVVQTVNAIVGKEKQDLEKISAIIKDNDFVDLTKIRIYFQNGQIWRQVDSTPYRGPKNLEGKRAFISSAALGSFLMKIEGVGGKFRVRREK
jgi:hypothetical protein|tara:strand:- start:725 stop:1249 length:525 start_codon:yes stop_codon:yes gene_type:complete